MTEQSASPNTGAQPIVLERVYTATPEELWDLWTTKEGFASWWGPQGFRGDVHTLDARVGGALHYDMVADSAEAISAMKEMGQPLSTPVRATFSELRPHTRLAITSVIDFLPGVPPFDHTIGVDFIPQGAQVRMVITLQPMNTPEVSGMQAEGMTSQLTKLDERYGTAA